MMFDLQVQDAAAHRALEVAGTCSQVVSNKPLPDAWPFLRPEASSMQRQRFRLIQKRSTSKLLAASVLTAALCSISPRSAAKSTGFGPRHIDVHASLQY
jgi:hypothetical protein